MLKHYFAPPSSWDEEKVRVARTLFIVQITLLLAAGVILIIGILGGAWPIVTYLMAGTPVLVLSTLLGRRGHLGLAQFLAFATMLVTLTYVLYVGQGVRDPSMVLYPVILIIGTLVLSRRSFVVLMALMIASLGAVVYGEMHHWVRAAFPGATDLSDFAIITTIWIVTAVVTQSLADDLVRSLARARRNEQALAKANRELHAEATERQRAEAEREALIKELKAKNTELEQFTYTVSHDLKSPLVTIRGFLGLVEKDALAGDQEQMHKDFTRIRDATDMMTRLLDELLELSRIGRIMNPLQEVPFAAIVQAALDLVRGRLEARGVTVAVTTALPAVYGDRMRLEEVIQNLVDNAAKFMGDQPAPHIEIGAHVSSTDAATVFYVRDNGIGIDPQYHERVFGLFNKLNTQSEGDGVGLALVKRIIEVHGGRVWIESSSPGTGTTFCFTLAGPPSARPTPSSL